MCLSRRSRGPLDSRMHVLLGARSRIDRAPLDHPRRGPGAQMRKGPVAEHLAAGILQRTPVRALRDDRAKCGTVRSDDAAGTSGRPQGIVSRDGPGDSQRRPSADRNSPAGGSLIRTDGLEGAVLGGKTQLRIAREASRQLEETADACFGCALEPQLVVGSSESSSPRSSCDSRNAA